MITSTSIASAQAPGIAASRLQTVDLLGPAGRLEAVLNQGRPDAPFAALVCHPHPLAGGTMHNKVVYHAMKALNAAEWGLGWPVLRFNFRGAGLSQGVHDGHAESADVLAALDWLRREYRLPLVLVGFSFGAAMALSAACAPAHTGKDDLRALAALGLPLRASGRHYAYPSLPECPLPKLFLSGDRDQYGPPSELESVVRDAAPPRRLLFIPRADHFFTGQLEPMQAALSGWLKESLS